MMKTYATLVAVVFAGTFLCNESALAAACPVPNTFSNGQVADASEVMENFENLSDCAEAAVTTTGSPSVASIAVVSGPKAITSAELTGDVTTSGSTATSLSSTGVTPGTYTSANITVDAKGRVTAATNGAGTTGEWAPLTFGTPSSVLWGGETFFKADQTQNVGYGNRVDVVVGFKHLSGTTTSIFISPDGITGYLAIHQSDNNWVLYRYASVGGSPVYLGGAPSYYNESGAPGTQADHLGG